MVEKLDTDLYVLRISLPGSPLKWLNSYIIKGRNGEKSLLIDTGYNHPACQSTLLKAIEELMLAPENTDVLLTHRHSDHVGNASLLYNLGFRIFMTKKDFSLMDQTLWYVRKEWALNEGVPESVFDEMLRCNPGRVFAPGAFQPSFVEDGDCLEYGGRKLRVVAVPGHTAGHICLYEEKTGLLFCGDHVLFDITPNICSDGPGTDSLGDYLSSLKKIRAYEVASALPSHRTFGETSFYNRIDEIMRHHKCRLDEVLNIIDAFPGINTYEISSKMTWHIKAAGWDDFPAGQKWFAISETMAHIDHLTAVGAIFKEAGSLGCTGYYIAE